MIEALIGLVGVLVGSAITTGKEVWISRLQHRRDGSFSAIRLICILEEYADACVSVVYDDGTAYGRPAGRTESGEEYCEPQVDAPAPLEFPEDIAWRSLPEVLMHRALALPNKARSTNRAISAASEHAFPPDYEEVFSARQKGYALLGLDALEVAEDLRKHYGIAVKSHVHFNTEWNAMVFLREKVAAFKEAA